MKKVKAGLKKVKATGPKAAGKAGKKLPMSVIAKSAKSSKGGKADPVPAAVIALLESNPFSSVIMVESEGKEGPLMLLVPDFCPKACSWSALDDGDVDLEVAEAAIKKHVDSGCKLVAKKDFAGLKPAPHVNTAECGHGAGAPKAKTPAKSPAAGSAKKASVKKSATKAAASASKAAPAPAPAAASASKKAAPKAKAAKKTAK